MTPRPPLAALAVALAVTGVTFVAVGLRAEPTLVPPARTPSASALSAPRGEPQLAARTPRSAAPPPVLGRSLPLHLDIPAGDIHTNVMPLGLDANGTVEVPPLHKNAPAGWYENSVTPGEVGAAVLLGHVDSARDGPGVFYRLATLRPGDEVTVRRADGTTAHFTVTDVTSYPKSSFPTRQVYGATPYPALRLVTCGGSFDRHRRTYRDNIVVSAQAYPAGHSTDRNA